MASVLAFAASAFAQDGTVYPLAAPAEPNAIPLGTGGVANQPAPESYFRQWGEPMARKVSTATLTPFLPDKAKANGAAAIVAPGGGFRWLSMNNEGWKAAQALADHGIAASVTGIGDMNLAAPRLIWRGNGADSDLVITAFRFTVSTLAGPSHGLTLC